MSRCKEKPSANLDAGAKPATKGFTVGRNEMGRWLWGGTRDEVGRRIWGVGRDEVLGRLWEIACTPAEETRGILDGQLAAWNTLAGCLGLTVEGAKDLAGHVAELPKCSVQ